MLCAYYYLLFATTIQLLEWCYLLRFFVLNVIIKTGCKLWIGEGKETAKISARDKTKVPFIKANKLNGKRVTEYK